MPHAKTSPGPSEGSRKKRQFKQASSLIAAAVSMPEDTYAAAVRQADLQAEGNFSRYVRSLIHRDLAKPA